MTSGNIRMGPDPDGVLAAIKEALRDDPKMRERPAEEVARDLARGGYLDEEPDPVLVAEVMGSLDPEGTDRETSSVDRSSRPGSSRKAPFRASSTSSGSGPRRMLPLVISLPSVVSRSVGGMPGASPGPSPGPS